MPDRRPESKDSWKCLKRRRKLAARSFSRRPQPRLDQAGAKYSSLPSPSETFIPSRKNKFWSSICAACFETRDHRQTTLFSYIFVVNKCEHQFRDQVVASCNFLECRKGSIKAQMIYMNWKRVFKLLRKKTALLKTRKLCMTIFNW